MQRGHKNAAFDRRADDGGELPEQVTLLFWRQRDRILDAFGERATVPQQKEQQVQHDEQTEHEVSRALPDTESLSGEELAALLQRVGEPFLHRTEIRQP